MNITKNLASFVAKTKFDDLPMEVVEHAKFCILDWLGAALAGCVEKPAKLIVSMVRGMGGRHESTVIGTCFKTSCANAALANGTIGHAAEMDDIHEDAIIHPAAPIVPAALAVAERNNASGQELITAVVLGYEVEIRIGMAINPSHYNFWHTTGTCGTFGAAAAAGKVLGLEEGKLINAFGIAGTEAAGLIEVFGTMSKPLNAGKAAMNGVIAAMLAQSGFNSSSTILEAEKGYCRAVSKEFKHKKLTDKLGKNFELVNNVFKRHASCGHTHGAIDAMIHITEEYGVKPVDVDRIVVATYPIAADVVGKNYEPKTASEAKFSLPFCVATALIYGRVGMGEFSRAKLEDQESIELSKRIRVVDDPEFANMTLGPAMVTLVTKSGEERKCRVDVPKGYPKNRLTGREIEQKFKTLASSTLPKERVSDISRFIKNLDTENVRNLMACTHI